MNQGSIVSSWGERAALLARGSTARRFFLGVVALSFLGLIDAADPKPKPRDFKPRIKWIAQSDDKAAEVYKKMGGGKRPVPDIIKTMSLQPEWMDLVMQLAGKAQFSDTELKRRTKEMIATYVSSLNKCKY